MSDFSSSLWVADQMAKKATVLQPWRRPFVRGAAQAKAAFPFLKSAVATYAPTTAAVAAPLFLGGSTPQKDRWKHLGYSSEDDYLTKAAAYQAANPTEDTDKPFLNQTVSNLNQTVSNLFSKAQDSGPGMSNIPVGTKEAEIAMRQEQGDYIPPGMGVPAQPGGSFKDTRPVVGGGTVHSRTGGVGKYTGRSIGIPGTQFQVPLGDISPTIDIPKNQALQGGGLSDIRTLGELDQLQGSSAFYQRGGGARQIALRRLELGQQLENEANYEAQMLQEAMSPAEIQASDQWLDATANSPAAQSGAFSNDQRWQTHLGDQQWQRDHGRPFTHGEFIPAAAPVGGANQVVDAFNTSGDSWTPNLGGFNQGSSWTPPPGLPSMFG